METKENKRMQLGKHNFVLLAVAAILLIVGYVIMSTNEITYSAIILGIVYVVIIPFALLWHPKKK